MCSRTNLRTLFHLSIFLKALLVCTLLAIGSIFIADPDLAQAYGDGIVNHGGGLIMIAALVPVSQYIGSRGSTQHNTFLLLIHVVFEASIFVIQFSIASEVLVIAAPEFGEDVRADCMRRQPIEEFQDECDAYRRSDRYHGFRLVWASNYERAQTEPDSFSKVDKFQNDGDCCGVAPPLSCIEDARKWPSDRPLTFVQPEFRSQRQICGSEPSWFPSSGSGGYSCSQVVDPTAATQVTGGCRYEMPLGACKDQDPTYTPGTSGCASILETTMNQDLQVKAAILLAFASFQVISVVAGCCLCWKRKATDVIPEYLERPAIDPYVLSSKKENLDTSIALKMDPLPCMMVGSEVEKVAYTPSLPAEEDGERGGS